MPTRPHIVMHTLPEDTPDRRTALADLRAAACMHAGVDLADIHPASGHDLSFSSYLSARGSWVSHFSTHPPTEYTVAACARARAYWERARPHYLAATPWRDTDTLTEENHHA